MTRPVATATDCPQQLDSIPPGDAGLPGFGSRKDLDWGLFKEETRTLFNCSPRARGTPGADGEPGSGARCTPSFPPPHGQGEPPRG